MSANPILINKPYLKTVNLGYKYKLLPNKEQQKILNHQMFVYNQAYNICLNLWKKESTKNKVLDKKDKTYRKIVSYDTVVKRALRLRKIKFSTVVTQQSRINFLKAVKKSFSKDTVSKRLKAIEKAITPKEKAKAYNLGFPTFQSSKDPCQSFNWNNQGYQINDDKNNNAKFKILRLLKQNIQFRSHRDLPKDYKLCSINISKDSSGYYVSFGIEFKKLITSPIDETNFDLDNSIGIDLNAYNIAISKPMDNLMNNISEVSLNHLIDNGATSRKALKHNKLIKSLERKQSRRVRICLKSKIKLGANHNRTQRKLNKLTNYIKNSKNDLYHKISTKLTNTFDMIVVEDLKTKNISKSSKGNEINHGKMVKQKSGLNRTILSASFYQFLAMLEYKHSMLNDKLLVKVNPAYTSQECSKCGCRDKLNRPKQHIFRCTNCGHKANPDIQATTNILNKGLQSIGVGITLEDSKIKAFRSETLVSAS
jgi:putative transposase